MATIPADLAPDLLEGWCGPVDCAPERLAREDGGQMIPVWRPSVFGPFGLWTGAQWMDPREPGCPPIRLVLARREVQNRIVDWAALGLTCETCDGCGMEAPPPSGASAEWLEDGPHQCPDCNGTGYLRAPCSLEWARDKPDALAWAVPRLVAGLPVEGLLGPWERGSVCWARHRPNGSVGMLVPRADSIAAGGWRTSWAAGPERGSIGKATADRAAMERGLWLEGGPFTLGGVT